MMEKENEKKSKTFKGNEIAVKKLNVIIKESGKTDQEFFEDWINELSVKNIEKNDDISKDLRKHFDSDVQKLKNATNSIVSTFISQMENISVEKNQWEKIKKEDLEKKQLIIDEKTNKSEDLRIEFNFIKEKYKETEKEKINLVNERDSLSKQVETLEKLNESNMTTIVVNKEKINDLNEIVVEKDKRIKVLEPMEMTNRELETEVTILKKELEDSKRHHEDQIKKCEENLIFEYNQRVFKREQELINEKMKEIDALREKMGQDISKYQDKFEAVLTDKENLLNQYYELKNTVDRLELVVEEKGKIIEKMKS